MNNRPIYILLTNTRSLFSTAIGLYTKQAFNHVSIAIHDDFEQIYSFGRKNPSNPVIGGFVNEVETQIFEYFSGTSCIVLKRYVSENEFQRITDVIRRFDMERMSYGYNLIGFAGFVVNYPIKRSRSYFCSQFVSEVIKAGGIEWITKLSELVKPSDFFLFEGIQEVYRGNLIQFLAEPKRYLTSN